ncbi:MAG: hypothetical protein HN366_01995 [Deltaproteobacteria bacterium]|mgnify:CR=1 FL=1|jgi:hypothetical protein|nr:hypothetical protein [Deltaproteobacteria bacterium]
MRETSERMEEMGEGYDQEYQSLKEEYDEISKEIDSKTYEFYEKWYEIDDLKEERREIQENKIEPFESEAFDRDIKQRISMLGAYSQVEAQGYRDELQIIKEEEAKEIRKRTVFREQEMDYSPSEPNIQGQKNSLYGAIESAIENHQEERDKIEEDSREEKDESSDDTHEN